MKTIYKILFVALGFTTISCRQDNLEERSIPGLRFSVDPFAREISASTKTSIASDGTTFIWAPDDTVGIFPNVGSQVYYCMTSGANSSVASFDGGGWLLKDDTSYWSYYPFIGDIYLDKENVPLSYSGQVQNGNANINHIGSHDFLYTGLSTPSNGQLNFSYHHINSILNVILNLPPGKYTGLEISASEPVFAESLTYDLSAESMSVNEESIKRTNLIHLSLDNVTISNDSALDAYLMVFPVDVSDMILTVSAINADGAKYSFEYSRNSPFVAGTIYTLSPQGYYVDATSLVPIADDLYSVFNTFFSGEQMYAYTNYGTDEFMVAGDTSNEMWNNYDSRLKSAIPMVNSNTVKSDAYWNPLYAGIGKANQILSISDTVKKEGDYNTVVGTAAFVRAFCYLFLTMQHGDIPMVLEPVSSPTGDNPIVPREELYKLIVSDLELAYELLPDNSSLATSPNNRITKYAAAHYLAQAHLWRASEINDSWNSTYKAADLDAVITYADEVIKAHPLTANFVDLYANFKTYDTDITETNSEIVLSAGYTFNPSAGSFKGNWGLALFTAWYQSFPLMQRDVSGARESQRLKTTPSYAYFIYDIENDSRFWKSFKTTYAVNKCVTNSTNKDKEITLGDGSKVKAGDYFDSDFGKYMSAMYIINRQEYGQKYYFGEVNTVKAPAFTGTTQYIDYNTGKYIPCINTLFIYDENGQVVGTSMQPDFVTIYCMVNKYLDGAVNRNNQGNGYRDGILARSAEDYFFKAEALIRQGKIDEGIAVLKPLRDRAQFKAGEKRDAYVDGGQAWKDNPNRQNLAAFKDVDAFYPYNSYYYSLGGWNDAAVREATNAKASQLAVVTKGNYPAEDMYVINKLKLSNDYDQAMCYLLNEKSREMYGELKRWMDLARTKTLESRLVFNDQANGGTFVDIAGFDSKLYGNDPNYREKYPSPNGGFFNPDIHYFRPIPQSYYDSLEQK